MNDDLLDFNKEQDKNKPFLSSDPLADKGQQKDTTPLPPVESTQPQKPQKTVLSPEEIDYSKSENKELARKRANELIDQGKFEEAAKILRDSGMHQTVKPAPQTSGAVPVPPPSSSTGDVQAQKSSQSQVAASQVPPTQQSVEKPELDQQEVDQPRAEEPQPTPLSDQPATSDVEPAGGSPTKQSPEVKFEPTIEISQKSTTPTTPQQAPSEEPEIQAPTPPKPPLVPTPPPKESSQPSSTPVAPDSAPSDKTPSEVEHPDDYLKKAYELRKELIEYDRTKLREEERLQAAEDLVFEGKKEEAIKVYREVARDAEEKGEREVAIEAMERLAALLR